MNTKTSNKLNIVLLAIILLLMFVACFNRFGKTNSWLINKDEIGFEVNVSNINIVIKQDSREIESEDNIYLGTGIIEADKVYDLNVTITNDEDGDGYFVRSQVIAVIDGKVYNINNYVVNDFYKDIDGWMYLTESTSSSTRKQMTSNETKNVIDTIKFPSSFIGVKQGKFLKLYLYIEGNSIANFNN